MVIETCWWWTVCDTHILYTCICWWYYVHSIILTTQCNILLSL